VARFDDCLAFTLKAEGGWSDRPDDDGGPTNCGITLETMSETLRRNCTPDDLKNISQPCVKLIYQKGFWEAMGCENYPSGIDLMVFDFGVNASPRRSIMELQDVVGAAIDGKPGQRTYAAVRASPRLGTVLHLADAQREYYRSLSRFPTFGRGWMARVQARMEAAVAAVVQ
jgi:lysozyme family protein